MNQIDVVKKILEKSYGVLPHNSEGSCFAAANIALCKYWGKRNIELNLPVTSSLSVSLGNKGTQTRIEVLDAKKDKFKVNGGYIKNDGQFAQRLINYLDLFRPKNDLYFFVETTSNIPIGAGLASSASGFAAIIQSLNNLFAWNLDKKRLSILARLGSGSACRSLWQGFVKWHAGVSEDGMDSFAEPLLCDWQDLLVGVCMISEKKKSLSSREAMQRTVATCRYYALWPEQVVNDMAKIEQAINERDFDLFGQSAEANALAMHALMLSSQPPILYAMPETIALMNRVWQLRKDGVRVYFTQDAGPNLKLLFLRRDVEVIKEAFVNMEVVKVF